MGLVVADALTHLQRCTVAEISDFVLTHRSIRNVRVAERLVPAIEPATESPMETRLRVTLVDGGLPRPVAQFELRDGRGRFVARLDFAYPQCRVAVEYDGAWHFGRRREDDRRRDAVRALGWIVIVVSADDIYGNAAGVCARVAAALESSVERDALGVIQAK
jgi:very-short-patch-repair endonuclease